MKYVLYVILCVLTIQARSQTHVDKAPLNCDGLSHLPIKVAVVLNAHDQKEFIKKSELLTYDFHLVLSDTTFNIVAFVAGYDRHTGSLLDINTRTYLGNKIEAGDPFITHIWL